MSTKEALFRDSDIRPILKSYLSSVNSDNDTVLIDELGICRGQVRIDVALVNGVFHGFEIKSDKDTLKRLPGQVEFYNKVLDKASIVVGEKHVDAASKLIPSWWGIIYYTSIDGEITLNEVRESSTNPVIDPRSVVELLWANDALELLEEHEEAKGVRSKPRRFLWDRISERIDKQVITNRVREKLKERVRIGVL